MEPVLDGVVTIFGVAAVGLYTWSKDGHFSSRTMPKGALVLAILVIATTMLLLYLQWTQAQPPLAIILGAAGQLAGLALFWAAIQASRAARLRLAFDEENPDSIVTTGPYRYLRHPFYTSYLIFWAGWTLAVWSPWAVLPLAIIIAVYVGAALDEERKFSRTDLAGEYQAYRQRTGFLWPRFR